MRLYVPNNSRKNPYNPETKHTKFILLFSFLSLARLGDNYKAELNKKKHTHTPSEQANNNNEDDDVLFEDRGIA